MKKLRVLFVGNSHTYFNDMPMVFKQLAEAGQDVEVEVTMQAHPGVTYEWHLTQGAELRFALVQGEYDYVFFQQAAHSPCPSPEETLRDGAELIRLAKLCGVKPVVTIPWAEKRFPEHQAQMYATFQKLAKDNDADASPVGYVFERVLAERPDIDMYWYDGEHCSPYGTYVNAACAYAKIFGVSPEGLPARSIKHNRGTAEDMARINGLMDELRELTDGFSTEKMSDPANAEKLSEVMALNKTSFPEIWDKKELTVELDPEKCATLQKWVWEAVQAQK